MDRNKSTEKEIKLAITRIKHGRQTKVSNNKLNVLNVANEAGIHHSTIWNIYPRLAEEIKSYANKTSREQRNLKHNELKKEKAKNKEYRSEIKELNNCLKNLATINANQTNRIIDLESENKKLSKMLDEYQNKVLILKNKH